VNTPGPRVALWKLLLSNALSLSAVYLACAVTFEGLRRYSAFRWPEKAVLVMESLPAQALRGVGALNPLRELYVYGQINEVALRLIFGGTTVAVIVLVAVGVGTVMGLIRRVLPSS
jgi:hypothetical protein